MLVDLNGDSIMSVDGGQINIPADSTEIVISYDGVIADQNGMIAQIGIFDFDHPQDMEKVGNTQLKTDQAPLPLGNRAKVVQGALEQANVNPILNMVEMTQVTKLYAANQRYIEESLKLQSKQTDMLVSAPPAS
jgi:flagellar basal-body rod protein FlgF